VLLAQLFKGLLRMSDWRLSGSLVRMSCARGVKGGCPGTLAATEPSGLGADQYVVEVLVDDPALVAWASTRTGNDTPATAAPVQVPPERSARKRAAVR
jgi:hypothetical protein